MTQDELFKFLQSKAPPLGYGVRKGSNPWVVFCEQTDGDGNRIQVAVYCSLKVHRGLTVATAINHPKKGKTQLFRKSCSREEVVQFLGNPRKHTGKGYYKRK